MAPVAQLWCALVRWESSCIQSGYPALTHLQLETRFGGQNYLELL